MTQSRCVDIIVPTYQEAQNIPRLLERLSAVRSSSGLDLRVLLMDDDSRDGSDELVSSLALPWAKLVTRKVDRGLSAAVLDGITHAGCDLVVVMDADLSHPPEKIPELIAALDTGADIAVGSRFAEGGSTADDWGPFRWFNSRVATILAMPLTTIHDPMSGFFAVRRQTLAAARDLNPVGYKILLEIIVKCRCREVVEIPIHFANRHFGTSKLSLREQLKYFRHLRRLYTHRYGTWSHLAQFLVVGASGLLINLALLTLFLDWRLPEKLAVGLAIGISLVWNFALNRRFSFSYARDRSVVRQFFGFAAACSIGAVVNYFTTLHTWNLLQAKQLAASTGVLAGTLFNFVATRFVVFRAKHFRG
jgi:dolichol-phosphate mannosyltransferase